MDDRETAKSGMEVYLDRHYCFCDIARVNSLYIVEVNGGIPCLHRGNSLYIVEVNGGIPCLQKSPETPK